MRNSNLFNGFKVTRRSKKANGSVAKYWQHATISELVKYMPIRACA